MGGSSDEFAWEIPSISFPKTLVLVGRTGNGKSATGNSILRREAFKSDMSLNGVTATCQHEITVLPGGQILTVIDTPGLFDLSDNSEYLGEEIVKCIGMAKDGIHAVLLVLSARTRFTEEEEKSIKSLEEFFGSKILDYMIVVFTGGDTLERRRKTLQSFLSDCPEPLRNILERCKYRQVVFNNDTTDEGKKTEQVEQLLVLVEDVLEKNGGKPFTNNMFIEMKNATLTLHCESEKTLSLEGHTAEKINEMLHKSYEDQHTRITKMVEEKLEETTLKLEKQLADEQAARLKAEEFAQEAQKKSEDEIRVLNEKLEKARLDAEELQKLREQLEEARREAQNNKWRTEEKARLDAEELQNQKRRCIIL